MTDKNNSYKPKDLNPTNTKNINVFKKGDKVEINSWFGIIYGIVAGYDAINEVYMVNIDGQVRPVDHHVGNMRVVK